MGYLYETHVHTSQSSSCARNTGSEMVKYYHNAGYSGVVVTDHFIGSPNSNANRAKTWREKIDILASGYQDAKQQGVLLDVDVLWGFEYFFRGTEFIILNISASQLLDAEILFREKELEEILRWFKANDGFIIHCHPFRYGRRIKTIRLIPEYTDAVEVFNGGNAISWPEADDLANIYAKTCKKINVSGSDLHDTSSMISGGIMLTERARTIGDLIAQMRNNNISLIKKTLI